MAASQLERQADTILRGQSSLAARLNREANRGSWTTASAQLSAWAEWLRTPSNASLAHLEATTDSLRRWDPLAHYADFVMGVAFLERGDLAKAERHLLIPQRWRAGFNASLLVPREYYLGRITEARGHRAEAREHYARFVRWWRDCDPELKPMWEDGRQRLAKLSGEPREP